MKKLIFIMIFTLSAFSSNTKKSPFDLNIKFSDTDWKYFHINKIKSGHFIHLIENKKDNIIGSIYRNPKTTKSKIKITCDKEYKLIGQSCVKFTENTVEVKLNRTMKTRLAASKNQLHHYYQYNINLRSQSKIKNKKEFIKIIKELEGQL